MNTFTVVFLCIQACLVQNVFGQCPLASGAAFAPAATSPFGYRSGYGDIAYPGAAGWAAPCGAAGPYGGAASPLAGAAAPYGGSGEGNVAVAGELQVAGNTAVAGQVPIMGAVNFGGSVPAAGAVSITGQCACGCAAGNPYYV